VACQRRVTVVWRLLQMVTVKGCVRVCETSKVAMWSCTVDAGRPSTRHSWHTLTIACPCLPV
jgi:hypothetical protein